MTSKKSLSHSHRWTISVAVITGAIAILAFAVISLLDGLAPHAVHAADSDQPQTGVVSTEDTRLNVRSGPGTDFDIVAKLDPGVEVKIVGTSDDGLWVAIESADGSVSGWASSEFVTADSGSSTTASAPASDATASDAPASESNADSASDSTSDSPSFGPRIIPAEIGRSLATRASATAAASTAIVTSTAGVTSSVEVTSATPVAAITATVSVATPSAVTTVATAADAAPTATAMAGSTAVATKITAATPKTTAKPSAAATAKTEMAEPADEDVVEFVFPVPTPTAAIDETAAAVSRLASTGAPQATVDVSPEATSNSQAETETAAEPEMTPATTPTPRPIPTVPIAVIQPDRMNARSGPGTNYGIVGSVSAGDELQILALGPQGEWYQVKLSGQDEPAWVFAGLVDALGPMDGLERVAEADLPPTPEAAPVVEAASAGTAAVAAAPPPSGAGFFGYGIQAHMLGGQAGAVMDSVSNLGFNWVKQQVEWKNYQPQAGAVGMGELGGIVSAAQARGINVLFSVVNAPGWAREPGFDNSVGGPPADPQTYANFVGAMAGQFCGTSLKAIEVWNEENLHYEWGNKPLDPAEYMNLLKASYASIKAACPEMLVISGALTPAASNGTFALDDFAYLEGMYQNGLAQYSDGIGAHPSGYNVPADVTWENACSVIQQTGNSFNGACDTPHHSWAFRSTMEGYRNIMTVYGDTNKRIWPTEFGWAAGGAFDPRYAYANDNGFDEQAAWTVQAYQMMKDWGWVGPAFLWNLNFRVVADGTEKAQWGIVGNDWQPLPTYLSLQAMPK